MGSFAFMCSCGCGLEVSPQYKTFEGTCHRCGNHLQDGGVAVAFMPDGEHIVDTYEDYGEIGELDLYAWLGRANRPRLCDSMKGFDLDMNPEAFWEATRNRDEDSMDTDRNVGIDLFYDKDEDYKYHIKIAFDNCVSHNNSPSDYRHQGISTGAPNQGFGNAQRLDCCGEMVCLDCTESCCERW